MTTNNMDEGKNDFQQHQEELYIDHLLTEGLSMHGKSCGYDNESFPLPSVAVHSGRSFQPSIVHQQSSPSQQFPSSSIGIASGAVGGNIVDMIHSQEQDIDGNIQHLVGGLLFEHIKHYPQRENLLRATSGERDRSGSNAGAGVGTGGTSTPTVSNITFSNPGSRSSSRPSTPTGIMRQRPGSLNMSATGMVVGHGTSNTLPSPTQRGVDGNHIGSYFYNVGNHPNTNLVGMSQLTAHDAFPNTAFYPVNTLNNNGPSSGSRNGNSSKRPVSPDVSEVTLFTDAKQSAENSPANQRDMVHNRKGVSPTRQYPSSGPGNNISKRNSSPTKRTSTTPTTSSRYAAGAGATPSPATGPNGARRVTSPTRANSSPSKVVRATNTPPANSTNGKQFLKTPVVAGSSPTGPSAKRSTNHRVSPRLLSPDKIISPVAKRGAIKVAMHSSPTVGATTHHTPVSKRNILNSAVGGRDLSFGRNGSMLGPFNLMTRELTDEQYKKFNQADLETLHRQLKLLKLQLKSKISCDRVENESMIKKLWLLVTTKEDEAYVANIQERTMEEFIRVHQRLLEIDHAMEKVLESVAPTFERLNLFNQLKIAQKDAQNQVKSIRFFNVRAKLNQDYAEKILNLEKAVKLLERMNEKRERLFITKIKDEATRLNAVAGIVPPSYSRSGVGRSGTSSGRNSPSSMSGAGGANGGGSGLSLYQGNLSHSQSERKLMLEERRREAMSSVHSTRDEDDISDKGIHEIESWDGGSTDGGDRKDSEPARFLSSREPSSDALHDTFYAKSEGSTESKNSNINASTAAVNPRLSPPNLPLASVSSSAKAGSSIVAPPVSNGSTSPSSGGSSPKSLRSSSGSGKVPGSPRHSSKFSPHASESNLASYAGSTIAMEGDTNNETSASGEVTSTEGAGIETSFGISGEDIDFSLDEEDQQPGLTLDEDVDNQYGDGKSSLPSSNPNSRPTSISRSVSRPTSRPVSVSRDSKDGINESIVEDCKENDVILDLVPSRFEEKSDDSSPEVSDEEGEFYSPNGRLNTKARLEVIHEGDEDIDDDDDDEDARPSSIDKKSDVKGEKDETRSSRRITSGGDNSPAINNGTEAGNSKNNSTPSSGSSSAKVITDSVGASVDINPPSTVASNPTDEYSNVSYRVADVGVASSGRDKDDLISERSDDDNASEFGGAMSVASDGTSQSGALGKKKKRRPTIKGLVKLTKSLFGGGKPSSSANLHENSANENLGSESNPSYVSPTKQNIQSLKSAPASQLMNMNQSTAWDEDLGIRQEAAKDFDLQSVSSRNTDNKERETLGIGATNASIALNARSNDDQSVGVGTINSGAPSQKRKSISFFGAAKGMTSLFSSSKNKDRGAEDSAGMDTSNAGETDKFEKSSQVSGLSNSESDTKSEKRLSSGSRRLSFFGRKS